MIPNSERIIRVLKLAGFTDLQARVLTIAFQSNHIDWNYLLQALENMSMEENK